jgi:MATE family multidrug resistance protein
MVMVGWLGDVELGAHQIVINLASLTYMVPLGLSIGAAARVGNLIGAREPLRVRRACATALSLGGGVMAVFGMGFVVFRNVLPRLYLEDPAVLVLAAALLPIGGAFQIADGLQVVGAGLMRGMGRPKVGAMVNLVGFYGLGLPLAWLLAFPLGLGLRGIWWGLAAGLGLVAMLLLAWVARTSRRPLDELRVALH